MYCVWLSSVKATSNIYLLNAIISPSLPLLVILWVMKQEDEVRGLSPAHPWSAGRWVRSLLPGWLVLVVTCSQDLYFGVLRVVVLLGCESRLSVRFLWISGSRGAQLLPVFNNWVAPRVQPEGRAAPAAACGTARAWLLPPFSCVFLCLSRIHALLPLMSQ